MSHYFYTHAFKACEIRAMDMGFARMLPSVPQADNLEEEEEEEKTRTTSNVAIHHGRDAMWRNLGGRGTHVRKWLTPVTTQLAQRSGSRVSSIARSTRR